MNEKEELRLQKKGRALIMMIISFFVATALLTLQAFLAPTSPTSINEVSQATSTPTDTASSSTTSSLTTSSQGEQVHIPLTGNLYKEGPFAVVRIVDGDTISVNYNNATQSVRLIGIDTPELHHPTKGVQCFGKEAAAFTTSLLQNRKVYLVFEPLQGTRDKYDRLLAYIYRDDALFINQTLVQSGYAHEYTYNLPYTYQKEFKSAQTYARENQKGLWAPETCNGDTSKSVQKK